MKPFDYYIQLKTLQKRQEYADRSGCSLVYMQQSLFSGTGLKKKPRDALLINLVNESEGNVSLDEAIDYFLVQPIKKLAKEMEAEKIPSQSSAASLPSANAEVPV